MRSGDAFLPRSIGTWLSTFLVGNYSSCIYISYWSILHLLSGVLTYIILQRYAFPQIENPYITGFLLHTLWELWQVFIGMSYPTKMSGHNGIIDTLMDTLLFMVGMAIAGLGKGIILTIMKHL